MLLCWCLGSDKWVWWKISSLFPITHKLHPKANEYGTFIFPSIVRGHQHGYVHESNLHKIDTQPEVQLRVGAFWCLRPRIFGRRHLPIASVHGKYFTLFFTKENSSLLTLKREQWIRMLCDNSSLQKLVKPKPLAGKMAPVKTQSWTSGWVSILWRNDLNAPWTYS